MVLQGDALIDYGSAVTITNTHFITMGKDSDLVPGSLECESSGCSAGQYGECKLIGQCYSCEVDVCYQCKPGKYSAAGTALESGCQSCEVGRFSNATGRNTSCSICSPGHYASTDAIDEDGIGSISGATFCVRCPVGKYQDKNESYYCDSCAAGYSSSSAGNINCTACDAGKYASSVGAGDCTACDSGKKANKRNAATRCIKCHSPWYSESGATNCSSFCDEGYYLDIDKGGCTDCPANTKCPFGTTISDLHLESKYWRINIKSTDILECSEYPALCIGGDGPSYCANNTHGPYCAVCDPGYWRNQGAIDCQSCNVESHLTNIKLQVIVGILCFIIALHALSLARRKYRGDALGKQYIKAKRKYIRLKTKLKTATSFIQIASSFPAQFDVDYPRAYRYICEQLSIVFSFQLYSLIPASCAVDTREDMYFYKLLIETLVPLVVIGIGLLYYALQRWRFVRNDKQRVDQLYASVMFWLLLFVYLVYPNCSTAVLNVFSCDDDIGSGEAYMYADYTTSCHTKKYRAMYIYAWLFVLIYPAGCPLLYFLLLWNRRSEIDPVLPHTKKRARMTENPSDVKLAVAKRLENHELAPLAFLYESYEPQYWWWEILVCLQRLLMTNAQIYVASQPLLRPFVVLIFALVSVKLYSLLDPFILDSDDLFAEIKEWSLVTIVIFGIIKQVYEESNTEIQAGSSAILNAAFLVVFGVLAYFCLKTISTEVSFFQGMLARLFPNTTEVMKKWGTETMDQANDEVTSVVEEHSDSDQETARCEEAAGSAASAMVHIQSEFYFPTTNLSGNEISTTHFDIEI